MASHHEPAVSSADDPERSVTLKGRYRIIGPGTPSGEAVTYAAETVTSQQSVALAVLRGDAAADAEFVAAVREQAYRLAKPVCHHPALVRVHDTGTTDEGEPFVALEPVTGRTLREVLDERGALGVPDGLRLAIQVGEGLEMLHRSGIVHGELRPEAVVLVKDVDGSEAAKLVGVELTAARRTPAALRNRDKSVGAYLAPEQIAYADTTEASDIYALGLLISELLTGQRPNGSSGRTRAEIPPEIARIVAKALERGLGRRYSSISLMVNDMWNVNIEPRTSSARADGPTAAGGARRSTARRRARSDVGMATALVVGLLLVGVTAWIARSDRLMRRAPSEAAESVVAASPVAPAQAAVPATPTAVAPASTGSVEPISVTLPPAPAPPVAPESSGAEKGAVQSAPPPSEHTRTVLTKPATVGAVRAPRPVARQPERPARAEPPSADGGDGTAIIDWLLKGGRSGG
jgi:serine/threonine protein kinase